jgi:hypothetical protein
MDKKKLQNDILEESYQPEQWLEILKLYFGAKKFHQSPQLIILPSNDLAEMAAEIGSFYTADERLIGIYEVKLTAKAWISKNRVGLRNLLRQVYKYDVDGALIVFVQDRKWRFSYVSEIRTEEGKKELDVLFDRLTKTNENRFKLLSRLNYLKDNNLTGTIEDSYMNPKNILSDKAYGEAIKKILNGENYTNLAEQYENDEIDLNQFNKASLNEIKANLNLRESIINTRIAKWSKTPDKESNSDIENNSNLKLRCDNYGLTEDFNEFIMVFKNPFISCSEKLKKWKILDLKLTKKDIEFREKEYLRGEEYRKKNNRTKSNLQ